MNRHCFPFRWIISWIILLLAILFSGCATFNYGLYDMALKHEHWKAGLYAKTLDWQGRPISYLENYNDGKKETMVLVHGFAANKENWVRFAGYLVSKYHVVIIDLPGHGESVKDFNLKYDWDDQVRYLHDILSRLNIRKCHMAGNSMGGAISCLYAAAYPDEVLSLLLIDPAGIYRYESELAQILKEGKNPLIVKTPEDFKKLMDFAMEKKPYIPSAVISVMADKAVENRAINEKIFADAHHSRGFEFEDAIQKIKAPTLIFWGAQDRIISVKNASLFETLIPGAQKIIFDGVGHAPMIEIPKESAKNYIDFLAFVKN